MAHYTISMAVPVKIIPAVVAVVLLIAQSAEAAGSAPMGMPGCDTRCGNMTVPYPFGMGRRDCYHSPGFNVTCDRSSDPPRLLVGDGTLQVAYELDPEPPSVTVLRAGGGIKIDSDGRGTLGGGIRDDGPFTLSSLNELILMGCNVRATVSSGNVTMSGCSSLCDYEGEPMDFLVSRRDTRSQCSGEGCCQAPIFLNREVAGAGGVLLRPFTSYDVEIQHFGWNRSRDQQMFPQRVFVATPGWFEQRTVWDQLRQRQFRASMNVPVYLQWEVSIGHDTQVPVNTSTQDCPADAARIICKSNNTHCNKGTRGGYWCSCDDGYTGNPYITNGCQGKIYFKYYVYIGYALIC
jgi:hypothetical protein